MAALDDIATLDELNLNINNLNKLIDTINPSDSSMTERHKEIREMVDSYNKFVENALGNHLRPGKEVTAEIAFAAVAEEESEDANIALRQAENDVAISKNERRILNKESPTTYEIEQADLRTRTLEAKVGPLRKAAEEAREEANKAARLRAANTEEMVNLITKEAKYLRSVAKQLAAENERLSLEADDLTAYAQDQRNVRVADFKAHEMHPGLKETLIENALEKAKKADSEAAWRRNMVHEKDNFGKTALDRAEAAAQAAEERAAEAEARAAASKKNPIGQMKVLYKMNKVNKEIKKMITTLRDSLLNQLVSAIARADVGQARHILNPLGIVLPEDGPAPSFDDVGTLTNVTSFRQQQSDALNKLVSAIARADMDEARHILAQLGVVLPNEDPPPPFDDVGTSAGATSFRQLNADELNELRSALATATMDEARRILAQFEMVPLKPADAPPPFDAIGAVTRVPSLPHPTFPVPSPSSPSPSSPSPRRMRFIRLGGRKLTNKKRSTRRKKKRGKRTRNYRTKR
jgi:hypothetical protein